MMATIDRTFVGNTIESTTMLYGYLYVSDEFQTQTPQYFYIDAEGYYDWHGSDPTVSSSSSSKITLSATGQTSITATKSGNNSMDVIAWKDGWRWTKTHSTQTITVKSVFTVTNWKKANGTTFSGTSTATGTFTVPAKDHYTVTLDANGGTGAAASLTKWYGENLTLPQPTKDGYRFSGWSDGTNTYTATYDVNAAATLTAVWTAAITSAHITDLAAYRVDSSGNLADEGKRVKIIADWKVTGAKAATVSLTPSVDSSPAWTGTANTTSKTAAQLELTGTAQWTTSTDIADLNEQYTVTVNLTADDQSDNRSTILAQAFYTMDVLAGGHGIAFGKPATQELFDVGMDTNFDKDVRVMGTPLVPVGTILDFAGSTAPTGYLVCDGSAVPRTTYSALFAVIGTTWGAGDGSTTFNIPDFRGRTAIGAGTGTATDATAHALGSYDGEEKHTLTISELATHAHQPSADTDYRFQGIKPESGVTGTFNLQGHSSGANRYAFASTNSSGAFTYWSWTQNRGDSSPHNIMQPFATVTKIIRAI